MKDGQLLMVKTEQVQDRRVKIVYIHSVFNGVHPQFVRGAVNVTTLGAASCKPDGKARVVMGRPSLH